MSRLASVLCASYLALWFAKLIPIENITISPLIFKEAQDGVVVIWGGWKTVNGCQAAGINAAEIRCSPTFNSCHEAVASILHYSEEGGEDLEAQVFNYKVSSWEATKLEAVSERTMWGARRLVIHLPDKSAALIWFPPSGCEDDTGRAVLVGDPL